MNHTHKTRSPSGKSYLGLFYAFLAAVTFSCVNLAVRFSEPYLTVWHMMFGRSLFGFFAMAVMAKWMGLELLGRSRGTLILLGMTGFGSLACLVKALVLLPLVEALLLFYLFIGFAALLSPWLTRDRVRPLDWVFLASAFAGTVLILWPEDHHYGVRLGHVVALVAAFGYGLTLTLIRRVSDHNNPLTPYFYLSSVGLVACVGPILGTNVDMMFTGPGALGMLVIAFLASTAHLATNKAIQLLPSPTAGVIIMSEVVFGGIFGLVLFQEPLGLRAVLGGILILASGVGLTLKA